ncbi:hypothetical protein RND81_08G035100 [Saponaria officinalis]|uniref:Secreted protein n=1 Tax=Saponaria officinalis TaxID=3572 RepID=A0AAW1J2S9_SAPOF
MFFCQFMFFILQLTLIYVVYSDSLPKLLSNFFRYCLLKFVSFKNFIFPKMLLAFNMIFGSSRFFVSPAKSCNLIVHRFSSFIVKWAINLVLE